MRFLCLILILCPLPFASARPIWQFTIAIMVALYGLFFCLRPSPARDGKLPRLFYLPVGALILLAVWGGVQILMGWSVAPEATIRMSVHILNYLLLFFLIFASIKKREDIPSLYRLAGLVVAAYCAYGLIVYFTGNNKVLWFDKWASEGSLTSTFVNRNSFAAYAGIGLNCLVAYSFWFFRRHHTEELDLKSALTIHLNNHLTQTVFLALSILMVLSALLLTASRAGIISAFIAVFFLIGCIFFAKKDSVSKLERSSKKAWGFFVLSIVFFCILLLSGDRLFARLEKNSNADLRYTIYPVMVAAIFDGPWHGTGLGTFEDVFAQKKDPQTPTHFVRAHNDYLELSLGAGPIIGAISILALLSLIIGLIKAARTSASRRFFCLASAAISLQLALHSILDFSLQIPAVAVTFLVISALCAKLLAFEDN